MEIDRLISSFKLDTLDDSWVDAVWDNEFMQVEEIPGEYLNGEEFDIIVQELKSELKQILTSSSTSNDEPFKIWDSLGSHIRRLLPVIYYFMKQEKSDNDNESRLTILNAAGLYFILLSIPGSSAYKVFRRLLYEAALDSFKLSSLIRDETSNKRRNRNDDAFDDEGNHSLFYGQKYMLAEGLNAALRDLLRLLRSFSIKDKSDSFELTVQTVTSLTLVDGKISQLNFTESQTSNYILPAHIKLEDLLHSLAHNAYVALDLLARGRLQNNHQPCVELVLDNLLPSLVWGGSEGTTRERTAMRHNVLRFVRQILLPIAREENHLEDTILTLIRHLCGAAVRMSAEVRRLVAATILELTIDAPSVVPILDWIIKFSHSEKSNHRLMSAEILSHMLLKSKDIKQLEELLPKIIESLVARFRDVSPSVCGRALSAISDCSMLPSAMEVICSSFEKELSQDEDDAATAPLTEGENFLIELMERTSDSRVVVRRSALQVLANLITAFPFSFRRSILLLLRHHCLDPSPVVRKQILSSMTNIICTPPPGLDASGDIKAYIKEVEESWLRGVLPQICDRDLKVREKALELSWNVLMGKTTSGGIASPNWHLIRQMEVLRLLPFLSEACSSWTKDSNSLGKDLWPAITQHLEGENQYPAWLLLSTVSEHSELPDATFIMNYYIKFSLTEELGIVEECTSILIYRVLGRVSIDLPVDSVKQLETHLLERMSEFILPASVIRPAVDALYLISRRAAKIPSVECSTFVPSWGPAIIQSCEQFIASAFQSGVGGSGINRHGRGGRRWHPDKCLYQDDDAALAKRMLTMADVALICPGIVKNSTIAAIQSILFPQPLPNARSGERSRMPSPKLCSVAVVVLGKLCLQDARLAARVVPSLGSLLQQPPATHPPPSDLAWAPLRNNVMCALSDMCRSFAQLVDPLLPKMSACLHSSDSTLRENALVLLVQLLQEDYLKVRRGALLFDLLTALNDHEIAVSQLASYYLGRCLVHSQPSIMYQNILPALFHYNNYQGHEIYKVYRVDTNGQCNGVHQSSNEEEQMAERRNIFRFMLQHITDDQRQKIIGKICLEVLGGVVEGAVSLDREEGCQLLSDAIWLLSSEEVRPVGLKSSEEEGEEEAVAMAVEEAAEEVAAVVDSTETEPPSKKRKNQFPGLHKEMLNVLLPIAVALMQRLEQLESPLLSHLMGFLVHTFKEYKIDVGDLAAGDKKLLDDIARNLKSFERK